MEPPTPPTQGTGAHCSAQCKPTAPASSLRWDTRRPSSRLPDWMVDQSRRGAALPTPMTVGTVSTVPASLNQVAPSRLRRGDHGGVTSSPGGPGTGGRRLQRRRAMTMRSPRACQRENRGKSRPVKSPVRAGGTASASARQDQGRKPSAPDMPRRPARRGRAPATINAFNCNLPSP